MKVPFLSFKRTNSIIREEIISVFGEFFDMANYVLGAHLLEFEKLYSSFNQVNHTVGVSNGLDAIHISLRSLGIGEGDEVIIPSNTFIATALAVSYAGAKPVFVEPSVDTYNLDPSRLGSAISERTKCIIPVHLYGLACEIEEIISFSKKHSLFVIEDNAQAHGASYKGKLTGSWGHINATSFYPGKNLGALGDAGAITTNSDSLASHARVLRNYGSDKKYYNRFMGYNMRMDECQASFLKVKLKYLNEWTIQRQKIASFYFKLLEGVGDIVMQKRAPDATHVYHLFVIRTKFRDSLQEFLSANGITTLIHYPIPPHLQECYQYLKYRKGDFPIAEELSLTCLSLPIWPGMTEDEVNYVCEKIGLFFLRSA